MPLLPDLATAGIYAVVVFLLSLGVLVVFIETVPRRIAVVSVLASLLVAALLTLLGELGLALLPLGFLAAILADKMFEWLTMR